MGARLPLAMVQTTSQEVEVVQRVQEEVVLLLEALGEEVEVVLLLEAMRVEGELPLLEVEESPSMAEGVELTTSESPKLVSVA